MSLLFLLDVRIFMTISQVQLLVSNSDVENYKQIKTDLDELRLLVEKSELWVYKSKKDLPIEKKPKGNSKEKKEAKSDDEQTKANDEQDRESVSSRNTSFSQVIG